MTNKELGRLGEKWFSEIFPKLEWINKKEESYKDYDFKVNDSPYNFHGNKKIDVKTTKANSWTFNVNWKRYRDYFKKDITYVFLYYDIEKEKISIQKILTSEEIIEFESVEGSRYGKPNCFIWKEKKNYYDNNR
tara:strand:+ start:253 stop:654 length:402 start_codon:yes stop_codon:yes gene_type:complete